MDQEELGLLSRYPAVHRRLLTVDDYHRMGEAGILTEDDRVELIEGELVVMSPIGSGHVAAVNALNRLLVMAVGDRASVSPQNPVRLDRRSEPQPDFAVLRPRPDGYRTSLPNPDDVLLAVEVADSSLVYDTGAKLALYASRGICEVCVVNLIDREVQIHRKPDGDRYETSFRAGCSDILQIEALPGVIIAAGQVFG